MSGRGLLKWANGNSYSGGWLNDKMHGRGESLTSTVYFIDRYYFGFSDFNGGNFAFLFYLLMLIPQGFTNLTMEINTKAISSRTRWKAMAACHTLHRGRKTLGNSKTINSFLARKGGKRKNSYNSFYPLRLLPYFIVFVYVCPLLLRFIFPSC